MRHSTLLKSLIMYFIGSSLLFTFLIPPFQKTDEVSHYYKTIALATGNVMCSQDGSGAPYHTIPKAYADLPTVLVANITNESKTHRFPITALKLGLQAKESAYQTSVHESISCSLPGVLYAPVALLLAAPIALHVPPVVVFYLGRLGFLLIGYAFIAFALKIVPHRYRLLLIGCLIVPTVGIQLGSFNKEVLHVGAGAVVFASYFKLREKFSKKFLLVLGLALYAVVMARPFYAPLFVLIPLVLPHRAFKYVLISAVITVSIFFAYLPKVLVFHNGVINSDGVSAPMQMEFLRQHPTHFWSVLWSSYVNHMPAYARSLIGTYGSIHYYLDWYVYTFFGAWLLWLGWQYRKHLPEFSSREIVGISLAIIGITISSFILFYLYATPVAYHWVIDVQGRYFIVVLPFVLLILATVTKKYPRQVLGVALSLAIFFFVKNAYDRYYDYSAGYVYEDMEKLTALSEKSELQTIEITQEVTRKITIDSNRELRGVSLIVVNPKGKITQPLIAEFYDANCEEKISDSMVMNHIRKSTAAMDLKTPTFKGTELCVKIKPFSSITTNAKPATLAIEPTDQSHQSIFMMPFYAY